MDEGDWVASKTCANSLYGIQKNMGPLGIHFGGISLLFQVQHISKIKLKWLWHIIYKIEIIIVFVYFCF